MAPPCRGSPPLHLHLVFVARPTAPCPGRRRRAGAGRALVAEVVIALPLRRSLPRRRRRVAHRPQGPDLRSDRRHRRRPNDLVARVAWGRAELGLPVLLGARRDAVPLAAHDRWLP